MYKILVTKRASKDLEKLDQQIRTGIIKKLKDYSQSPLHFARKLIDPAIGSYRFRMGNYRVIFDIDDDNIVILRVGHRKDIYK